jgi:hypothetical protein
MSRDIQTFFAADIGRLGAKGLKSINRLRTEVYFCHQNQNAKNIGNFMTVLKLHNIGPHLKGIWDKLSVATIVF